MFTDTPIAIDRPDAEVAHDRIEVGPPHRADAVHAHAQEVGRLRIELVDHLGRRCPELEDDAGLPRGAEQSRVGVVAETVRTPRRDRMDHVDVRGARRLQQPRRVRDRLRSRRLDELREDRLLTEHALLALLRDDSRGRRVEQGARSTASSSPCGMTKPASGSRFSNTATDLLGEALGRPAPSVSNRSSTAGPAGATPGCPRR